MAIPGPIDGKLAEIDDYAAGLLVCLRQFRYGHADEAAQRRLRQRLQAFNDIVVDTANMIINGEQHR